MRKFMAALTAVMLVGGTGALAAPGNGQGPDPYGPAKYGLCKAYFSGQGGEHGRRNQSTAFGNLEAAAEESYEGDENDPIETKVADFCDGTRPSNGQGNGRQDDSSAPNPIP